ncbi:MAG: tetratricopeptide repeat protein [Candidatus Nitrosocosmicus sp.]
MYFSEVNLVYSKVSPLQPANQLSSLSVPLSILSQDMHLVDQIAQKIVDLHLSINYYSVKTAIKALSLQSKSNGENVNKALNFLLQQVTIDRNDPLVKKIVEHAMKESNHQSALTIISSNLTTDTQKSVSDITELSREELSDKGYQLSVAGKYNEAMPYFDRLLKLHPLDTYALFEKASLLYELGEYAEAILHLDKVLRLNQNDTGALLLKGHALNDLGRDSRLFCIMII